MLYLIRLAETGREAQPQRRRLRDDVAGEIRARVPGAEIETGTGRIYVRTGSGAAEALGRLHGVASFSPCVHCTLDTLEQTALKLVAGAANGARTFRVRVKRVGDHPFGSMDKAADLGGAIHRRWPDLRVDMRRPDLDLGVEIRDRDCYLFTEVIPGVDRRGDRAIPPPANEPRFLCDQMLGTLVPWLRLLGFDTLFLRDQPDSLLLRRARAERRVLLTRDRELSRARSARVLYLRGETPSAQLEELASALDLRIDPDRMFTRCTLCNRPVRPVDKAEIAHLLPEVARRLYDSFTRCDACDKLYWKGGQYQRILAAVQSALSLSAE